MKRVFSTRKGIFLLSQILASLVILSGVVLVQIGAFAGAGNELEHNTLQPTDISPTMLVATKEPVPPAPAEENPQPPTDGVVTGGTSGQSAMQACVEQLKASSDAASAVSRQAWQIWDQIIALQNAAAATTDATESANLLAQAEALRPEYERLNNLGIQMFQDRLAGHNGMGCGPNGLFYTD